MNDFAFTAYRPELRDAWDAVVRRSKNGCFLHLRDALDHHADRFRESSLLVARAGQPVAVLPCNRQGTHLVSHGALGHAGLIYGMELQALDMLTLLGQLRALLGRLGATVLAYKAVPHVFHRYPAEEDLYALTRLQARLVQRDLSSAILLRQQPRLPDARKAILRKAVASGVTIGEAADPRAFHQLLAQAQSRCDVAPVPSLAEIQLLRKRFPTQVKLFAAQQDGRLLAGALVHDFGATVHTQSLACTPQGRACGALDLLLHDLVARRFADRMCLSLGVSTCHEGRDLDTTLAFQKEGLGGRGVVHDVYELDL